MQVTCDFPYRLVNGSQVVYICVYMFRCRQKYKYLRFRAVFPLLFLIDTINYKDFVKGVLQDGNKLVHN